MSKKIISDADSNFENSEFSLEELAKLITEMGVSAWVYPSEGGCANLYAGKARINEEGEYRYTLTAGPGVMSDVPTASYAEFTFAPDDDGVSDAVSPQQRGITTLRELAARMAEMALSLQ